MKKNLGRYIALILIFMSTLLGASNYEWKLQKNKTVAHQNEAVYLHYTCTFDDRAELYAIDFKPLKETSEYRLEVLREDEKILNGHKINEYEFVLFVKKAGAFSLTLDTMMKKTNKDSIENGVLGRDNANYEEFAFFPMKQEPIELEILATKNKIVGEFSLKVKKDTPKVKAYTPYHLEFRVEGLGDFQVFKDINIEIEGVEVFSEEAKEDIHLKKEGYSGSWVKKFAFVSDKSYVIPAWSIEYFDLKRREVRELKFDAIEVKVSEAAFTKEELLDEERQEFTLDMSNIYYLLTFIAGFLVSKIKIEKREKKSSKERAFCQKIEQAKSLEALCVLLISSSDKKYNDIIVKIDSKELTSLSRAKKLICG